MVQPMTVLTKADLRDLYGLVTALQPPGRAVSLAEVVRAGELAGKIATMVAEHRAVLEKGALVLSWRIPREMAPTLNEYAFMKGWQRKKRRAELDAALRGLLPDFPRAELHVAKRQRWVRATRFSTQAVDDISLDVLGAKMPLDSLVRMDVLSDDNASFLIREGRWEKCKRGETSVLLEVFEVTTDGRDIAEPVNGTAPPAPARERGAMVKSIIDAKAGA